MRAAASAPRRPATAFASLRSPQATARKLFHYDVCGSLSRAVRRRPTRRTATRFRLVHVLRRRRTARRILRQPPVCDANPRLAARWHDATCCSPQDCAGCSLAPAEARYCSRMLTPRSPQAATRIQAHSPLSASDMLPFCCRTRLKTDPPFAFRFCFATFVPN